LTNINNKPIVYEITQIDRTYKNKGKNRETINIREIYKSEVGGFLKPKGGIA